MKLRRDEPAGSPVRLTRLLSDSGIQVEEVRGDPDATEVTAVDFDSRAVLRGSLFCCVPGATTDGHVFAAQAVRSGATALLVEHLVDLPGDRSGGEAAAAGSPATPPAGSPATPPAGSPATPPAGSPATEADDLLGTAPTGAPSTPSVTQVRVAPGRVRPAMARLAAAFFGDPSRDLVMAGITGTNGKTTVAHLVRSILDTAGIPTGVIGTLEGERTTPEAPTLQALLAGFLDEGRRAVAMEVSSHALTQYRVDGVHFDVAAFTNLSHDHLDHHHSMEEYFAAKASLFTPEHTALAVVNVDDPWGERLAHQIEGVPVVAVRRSDAADISLSVGSSSFRWRGHQMTLPLTGAFNVDNALLAATVATSLGAGEEAVVAGLASAPPVPGRMEVVTAGPPFAVLVDFAHTPAGLRVALSSARRLAGAGRVVCVFGCGGDRDADKRPLMGEVSSRLADVTVLTSDNPRSEDPMAIIQQVEVGIDPGTELVVEPDRATAIARAVDLARPGDVVVVAGKGHETAQLVAGVALPFDDRVEVRRALARRGLDDPRSDR